MGILGRVRPYIDEPSALSIYFSLIHSYLMYCVSVWGATFKKNLRPLITLQKKAMRIVGKVDSRAPSEPLFKKFKVLPLDKLVLYQSASIMHQVCLGTATPTVIQMFTPAHADRTLNFILPLKKSTRDRRSFSFTGVKVWNNLPLYIKRACCSTSTFNRHLKKFLSDASPSQINCISWNV